MGSGVIPLNIELQQDDRTVCCGHTDMPFKQDKPCTLPLFCVFPTAVPSSPLAWNVQYIPLMPRPPATNMTCILIGRNRCNLSLPVRCTTLYFQKPFKMYYKQKNTVEDPNHLEPAQPTLFFPSILPILTELVERKKTIIKKNFLNIKNMLLL